ncbi:hypothetical protein F383_36761 [Gossypium arboreum]|uniref:Uncharacterized protein n=1 Tax=Gossypium arboreum TaxID=29729 RepID=A0A0B0M5T6_GOSAR|nr:hypothetical protein F383_36761 [Gossypium arboreum]
MYDHVWDVGIVHICVIIRVSYPILNSSSGMDKL